MKKSICLAVFVLILSVIAVANAPAPTPKRAKKSKPSIVTTMSIRLDRDATEPKLTIPRSQLRQLRAELDEVEHDDGNTASAGSSRTQTIVGGIFLSLAFVFGGIWFVRSGKAPPTKTFVVLAALAGIASAATFIYANVGPPPEARSISGKMFSQSMHMYKGGWGKVKLEMSNDGDTIEFIVPDPKPATGEE